MDIETGRELCRAVGLDPGKVAWLTIHVSWPRIEVEAGLVPDETDARAVADQLHTVRFVEAPLDGPPL